MENKGLLTRMGRWFKGAGGDASADLPGVGRDGFLEGVPAETGAEPATGATPRLSKAQLREQALDKLQDGHLKVITLIASLQKHMEAQDGRGQAMASSLSDIARNLGRLSETAKEQTETLGGIATQLQTGNDRSRRWEEALTEFPALAKAQQTTLATLGEQLAVGHQADERIGQSLDAVRGTLDVLDRSTTTSTETLKGVQESSAHSQELVGELIRKQRTWLARLVVVTLCVALAAVTLAVIALVR